MSDNVSSVPMGDYSQYAYNPHDLTAAPEQDFGTGMAGMSGTGNQAGIPATTQNYMRPTVDYIVQPGENVAQLTKRVYGVNTAMNRQRLRRNNPDLSPGATISVTE